MTFALASKEHLPSADFEHRYQCTLNLAGYEMAKTSDKIIK